MNEKLLDKATNAESLAVGAHGRLNKLEPEVADLQEQQRKTAKKQKKISRLLGCSSTDEEDAGEDETDHFDALASDTTSPDKNKQAITTPDLPTKKSPDSNAVTTDKESLTTDQSTDESSPEQADTFAFLDDSADDGFWVGYQLYDEHEPHPRR